MTEGMYVDERFFRRFRAETLLILFVEREMQLLQAVPLPFQGLLNLCQDVIIVVVEAGEEDQVENCLFAVVPVQRKK